MDIHPFFASAKVFSMRILEFSSSLKPFSIRRFLAQKPSAGTLRDPAHQMENEPLFQIPVELTHVSLSLFFWLESPAVPGALKLSQQPSTHTEHVDTLTIVVFDKSG